MINETQPHQTMLTSPWSTTRINAQPDLVRREDSIVKCSCNAEVSTSARFCPHCGTALMFDGSTAPVTLPITRRLLPRNESRKEGRRLLTEVTTVKEADWVPPLPPKYKAALQQGTAPELVLWEMFKRIIEFRNLLEDTVRSLPPELSNNQIRRTESFLRSHCAACGEHKHQAEGEKTPICLECQSI